MALTFTLVSFTCVAPFYGSFASLVSVAQSAGTWVKLISAAAAYSVTFALPFFLLAMFPRLMRALPQSGGWMNTIKVVMGFLELAAAFGFLRAAERGLTASQPQLLTFDLVLGIYVILSITCGLYLLNVFRLPHDYEPLQTLSVPRLLFAVGFLTLGLYLAPALVKQPNGKPQEPRGAVFGWVRAFLRLDHVPEEAPVAGAAQKRELVWLADLKEGVGKAKQGGKRVFIDFTGDQCKNCALNEEDVFPQPAVHELLSQYVLVQLYTDYLPGYIKNGTSAEENAALELKRFGDSKLPLYAVVEPDGNDYKVVEIYNEGKINSVSAFEAYLKRNLPK
jgi:thiol:disulfide interchange protein DsbD